MDWLRLEFLPVYSPDFNPIERLWKWIKQKYTHNKCWSSKLDLRQHLEKNLADMLNDKEEYIGTMKRELFRLKAAFEHHAYSVLFANSFQWYPPIDSILIRQGIPV